MDNSELFNIEELQIINNALNEILNGPEAIDIEEFFTRIGATTEDAEKLLRKVNSKV